MKMKLLALGVFFTTVLHAQVAPHAVGKRVIYIQDLLNRNSNGIQTLMKKAEEKKIVLEWESYEKHSLFGSEFVENKNPPAGKVDFLIVEVEGNHKKRGWKNYHTRKYALKDAYSGITLKQTDVLFETYTGGCKDNGMCVQVQSSDKELGTSKTGALVELMDYANTLVIR